jgi:hypothetical protein
LKHHLQGSFNNNNNIIPILLQETIRELLYQQKQQKQLLDSRRTIVTAPPLSKGTKVYVKDNCTQGSKWNAKFEGIWTAVDSQDDAHGNY